MNKSAGNSGTGGLSGIATPGSAAGTRKRDQAKPGLGTPGVGGGAGGRNAMNSTSNGAAQGGEASINDDPQSLVTRISLLERDLERRQESYVARERAYKCRIDELEDELTSCRSGKTGWMKTDNKIGKLKQMQGQIMGNIDLVQDRTAKILQEQERDLLRAFRARLFDVQTELEKEKSKKDDGAGAWIEKCRQLEAELEWAKEVSDRLERVNQSLLQENGRLKSQFTSQEEDRNFLIKQLVAVKKDNARLRAEYSSLEGELDTSKLMLQTAEAKSATSGPPPSQGGPRFKDIVGGSGNMPKPDNEEKYKEINNRMKRLLAEERKSLTQLRQNYANELKSRTELEQLLRQCVDDVRKEIAKRKLESAQFANNTSSQTSDLSRLYNRQPGLIPVEDFTQEDRERALELLLAQERVVTLLYAKSFPINPSAAANSALGNGNPSSNIANNKNPSSQLTDEEIGGLDGLLDGLNNRPQTTSTLLNMAGDRLPLVSGQAMPVSAAKPHSSK